MRAASSFHTFLSVTAIIASTLLASSSTANALVICPFSKTQATQSLSSEPPLVSEFKTLLGNNSWAKWSVLGLGGMIGGSLGVSLFMKSRRLNSAGLCVVDPLSQSDDSQSFLEVSEESKEKSLSESPTFLIPVYAENQSVCQVTKESELTQV